VQFLVPYCSLIFHNTDIEMYRAVVRLLSTVSCFIIFIFISYILALLSDNLLIVVTVNVIIYF